MKLSNPVSVPTRQLAKLFASALPIKESDFAQVVDQYIEEIEHLPNLARQALNMAYVFSRKVPRDEREDMLQELALAILECGKVSERLAYTIAKRDWQDWWKSYKLHSQFLSGSLNKRMMSKDGNSAELGELLVGEVDFERRVDGLVDGEALYQKLPSWIQKLVSKRLTGRGLTGGERRMLDKFASQHGELLLA